MERLRISTGNPTDGGQRFAGNVADEAEMQAREVVEAPHIMEEVAIRRGIRIDEGNGLCRWPNSSHGTFLLT